VLLVGWSASKRAAGALPHGCGCSLPPSRACRCLRACGRYVVLFQPAKAADAATWRRVVKTPLGEGLTQADAFGTCIDYVPKVRGWRRAPGVVNRQQHCCGASPRAGRGGGGWRAMRAAVQHCARTPAASAALTPGCNLVH
jgi:hypothetical protein